LLPNSVIDAQSATVTDPWSIKLLAKLSVRRRTKIISFKWSEKKRRARVRKTDSGGGERRRERESERVKYNNYSSFKRRVVQRRTGISKTALRT
jgi:hypothetical protein